MPILRAALALGIFSTAFFGQSFEVASVKPAAPNSGVARLIRGGPGSTSPGSMAFTGIDLFSLLTMAYDIRHYQLSGPDWLSAARFDITARIAPGTTPDQYRHMLRTLLTERFHLTSHQEKKEMQSYELAIGKSGSKLTKPPDDPTAADDGSLQPPALPSRPPMGFSGGVSIGAQMTMEQLAARLSGQVGQPVSDATGLPGKYEIKMHYLLGSVAGSTEPSVFDALPEQLGLKLVPKKGIVDILVIDHIERLPTAN